MEMAQSFIRFFLTLLLFLIIPVKALASEYTFPYPGIMPGNKLYKLVLYKEKFDQIFYFGDLAQYKLNQKLSDKYLIEAKTLFEYRQYSLAVNSLSKSNEYFKKAKVSLNKANKKLKSTREKEENLKNAVYAHNSLLEKIISWVPKQYDWVDESGNILTLYLHKDISNAMSIRNK